MNLSVNGAAVQNGLGGVIAYQCWNASEVLVTGVPATSLSGRWFEVSCMSPKCKRLLAVEGLDRLCLPNGQVGVFGSHRLWREAFDTAFPSPSDKRRLVTEVQVAERGAGAVNLTGHKRARKATEKQRALADS